MKLPSFFTGLGDWNYPIETSKLTVQSSSCESELRSLQNDCRIVNSTYDYCKDNRFVEYPNLGNSINVMISP